MTTIHSPYVMVVTVRV